MPVSPNLRHRRSAACPCLMISGTGHPFPHNTISAELVPAECCIKCNSAYFGYPVKVAQQSTYFLELSPSRP